MSHPNSSQARSTSRAKFKNITGRKSDGQTYRDEPQSSRRMNEIERDYDMKAGGAKAGGRLDKKRADGGAVSPFWRHVGNSMLKTSMTSEKQVKASYPNAKTTRDYQADEARSISDAVPRGEDKYARGGRTKHKGTDITIVMPQGGRDTLPPPSPPGLGAPPLPPPAGAPPLPMRKRGGAVPMKGGDNGIGRLDKAKAYGMKGR